MNKKIEIVPDKSKDNARGSPSEGVPKASENLQKVKENIDAFQKLRETVLKQKFPVVNATEDNLQEAAVTINEQYPQINATAPDFYRAASSGSTQ